MDEADGWFVCRIGFVEAVRAVGLVAGQSAAKHVRAEWGAMNVIEVDQDLVEAAAKLAVVHDLRSLDALHLAAASLLPEEDLVVATWDRRMHAACVALKMQTLPRSLD